MIHEKNLNAKKTLTDYVLNWLTDQTKLISENLGLFI